MNPDIEPQEYAGPDDPVPEQTLVALARSGEEAAVRELIRRLNPRLFRVARGIADSDAAAEEIVQDAYITAFTRLEEFRGEARFSTWITRIVVNTAKMQRRSRRHTEAYDTVAETRESAAAVLPFPGQTPEAPEAALGRNQFRALLEEAIGRLPPELRLVFLLREAEGMTIKAIAEDLRLHPVTVKTRLFRARRQLRRILERHINGGFESLFPFAGARCTRMAERVVNTLGGHLRWR
ncbi:RNA polymerase sigma factor [Arhodomonas sp. SL1]|uniref:RNA polymerase sigma factor n=1 Tax=Arhodomonas sp. SL1 TaxID=3425691 RepID=UPI003F882D8B